MRALRASAVCDRVCEQISLGLDGELTQLERRMAAAHLARCADCRAFEEAAVAFTAELRAAPLEPLRRPVVVRRSRRLPFAASHAAAVAVVALAAVGVVGQLGLTRLDASKDGEQSVMRADPYVASWPPEWEVAQLGSAGAAHKDRPGPVSTV